MNCLRFECIRNVSAVVALALFAGCRQGDTEAAPAAPAIEPAIYTTFYPTTYLAQRIVGDAVPVVCPLPADEDAIFWQPPREILERYQQARLIVVNGAELEKWVATASLPPSRIVDTSAGFEDQFVTYQAMTHSHGPAGEHTHQGIDGHTWMDPNLASLQAQAIAAAAAKAFPEHAGAIGENMKALEADLFELGERLEVLSRRLGRVRILCSHPAYNYLARRYGWVVTNLDLDPRASLSNSQLEAIERAWQEADPPDATLVILLWESEPLERTAASLLSTLDIHSVVFSPAETLDPDAAADGQDYLSIMHANIDRLEAVLP